MCPEVPFQMVVVISTINESLIKSTSPGHESVETQSVPLTSETGVRAWTLISLFCLSVTLHTVTEVFHYPKEFSGA